MSGAVDWGPGADQALPKYSELPKKDREEPRIFEIRKCQACGYEAPLLHNLVGKHCPECGFKQPSRSELQQAYHSPICDCGAKQQYGRYCKDCGKPMPVRTVFASKPLVNANELHLQAMDYECPTCHVKVGETCKTAGGQVARAPHLERVRLIDGLDREY